MNNPSYSLKNLRAFKISFICPTNTLGSRIKIEDLHYNPDHKRDGQKKSVIIGFGYEYNNTLDNALEYLQGKGFSIVSYSQAPDCYLIQCDNWGDNYKYLV
jgi:hypothetical protein